MGPETSTIVLVAVVGLVGWLAASMYRERRNAEVAPVDTHDRRPGVFVSYRRVDWTAAGRIADALGPHYRIVRDVVSFEPGLDHRTETLQLVEQADVVLVVVARGFLEASGSSESRIHSEGDFVRAEILHALKKERGVVPVLVGAVEMPSETQLPHDIADFAHRTGIRVRDDPHFREDCSVLASHIDDVARRIREGMNMK